jgi:hypothetical protein
LPGSWYTNFLSEGSQTNFILIVKIQINCNLGANVTAICQINGYNGGFYMRANIKHSNEEQEMLIKNYVEWSFNIMEKGNTSYSIWYVGDNLQVTDL